MLSELRGLNRSDRVARHTHVHPTLGQVVDWNGPNVIDRVSAVARVEGTNLVNVPVGSVDQIPLAVVVIAQWQIGKVRYGAFVKNAPVTFSRFNEAEFALGESIAVLAPLFQGSQANVIARVHAAAHAADYPGAPAGEKAVKTDEFGFANVYVAPDPVIANNVSGVLQTVAGEPYPRVVGTLQVMATVKGGTSSWGEWDYLL